jgi:O-6-methylguanine DNA methyltransferase
MTTSSTTARLAGARADVRAMRRLAGHPPATLAPAVLEDVGLADRYLRLETPIGDVFVAWNGLGISAVDREVHQATFEADFRARFGRPVRFEPRPPQDVVRAVRRRLEGDRRAPLRFDLRGRSPFERDVLEKAAEIPRGEVRSYGWVAREIGRPRAMRAVGSALGGNPIPLLIPCHRVVRGDGTIGEYGLGGPEAKRRLLAWEGVDPDGLERLARAGIRYVGSDTTRIFCLPTCRHARRIGDAHRRLFHTAHEAETEGYRACLDCRPALALAG